MSNDYIDYNNEEVSNYTKSVDPREHNVVNCIKELQDYDHPIIEDDKVSIENMKNAHSDILEVSTSTDNVIMKEIDEIKSDIEDDPSFIVVGEK